jgi:hypothetical protein
VLNDQDSASNGPQESEKTDAKTVAQGFVEQKQGGKTEPKSETKEQGPCNSPSPVFPVSIWRRFVTWWINPFRPRGNFSEHMTVAVSVIIAVIAFLQWGVYRQQKRIMESSGPQTQQLIDAANTQACASQRIADASGRNAAAASAFSKAADRIDTKIGDSEADFRRMAAASERSLRTVSQTDQRAWVGVTGIKGITLPKSPEDLAKTIIKQGYLDIPYTFTVENSGKTPARYMKVRTTYTVGADPVAWPNPWQIEDAGFPGMIFPGKTEENISTRPVRIAGEDVVRWQLGTASVYIYIVIEYNDIFPNTKVHHTWICSKYGAFGQQTFCHTGNDAD